MVVVAGGKQGVAVRGGPLLCGFELATHTHAHTFKHTHSHSQIQVDDLLCTATDCNRMQNSATASRLQLNAT